ncbi:trissin receptor isoform X2 [Eupeodes corollae]|uniref:trissin receptor isoform X2 n=1 Tax=Eupeodes corollae TaxID=290404 RepID=UPI00248FDBB6|nr:trissin receptor isoform X2 [Eupeodes corollae]
MSTNRQQQQQQSTIMTTNDRILQMAVSAALTISKSSTSSYDPSSIMGVNMNVNISDVGDDVTDLGIGERTSNLLHRNLAHHHLTTRSLNSNLDSPSSSLLSSSSSSSSLSSLNSVSVNNFTSILTRATTLLTTPASTSLSPTTILRNSTIISGSGGGGGGVGSGEDESRSFTQLYPGSSSFITNQSYNLSGVYIDEEPSGEYVFDRTDVRVIFITLYTMVFCCCFFGNLLVILVVTLSRRLRSITNFFLANLALADFCVGLFCVMQNLSIYLIDSWVFGEFLCRMYQFVHSLSYTASIFILVVICMERYFAIVHPITCKQILTAARLRMVIFTVWITSAVYSTPKFVFSKTIRNVHTSDGAEEDICVLDRKMFNSKLLDMINFGLLYVTPLLVMTVLYSKIAIALWRSSRGLTHHFAQQDNTNTSKCPSSNNSTGLLARKQSSKYDKRGVNIKDTQNDHLKVSMESDRPIISTCRNKASFHHHQRQNTQRVSHMSHSSNNVLRARRGVVRMLIIFVLTFALCNLPYHARKMWQYWSRSYRGDSNFNALLTPLTFLITYFNSGVNPLLYAFLSRNFRKGMKELLMCSLKKGKGKSSSTSVHHKRAALQTQSLPTDSTHIGNDQL